MKKFLLLTLVLFMAACQTTGTSPWNRGTYDSPAQHAPSQLTRDATATTDDGALYTPHTAPGEVNQPAPDQTADGTTPNPYITQPGQSGMGAGTDNGDNFDVTIGKYTGANDQNTGTAPQSPMSPVMPSLPPVKVALLLPLSGPQADLGQALLQAAQLALFDMGYKNFELMPRDTRGTPQGAGQAAQAVISEGAQLILGPLFAQEVQAAKPIAARYSINMIAFSTDWSLAGGNTYIMGFLPFAQVQRVAQYAAQNGFRKIGILAPNTDYGNAVIAAYNSMAYRAGLNTADVVRFAPDDDENNATLVRNFTKYDSRMQALEEQKMPLEDRLKANPRDADAKAQLKQLEENFKTQMLPFDAVLLPVGGEQARTIAGLLSYYELEPDAVKRLGTGLWDEPGLATEPSLDGAWFAAPSPDLRRDFERKYTDLYGLRPPRLASLAYDATALAAVLARTGFQRDGRPAFDQSSLSNPNGFAGIDGIFRFRPDGLIERGLAVLEFKDAHIEVIDPAPTTFQNPTY